MKYSGVPWIGDIPKEWKVLRIKDVVNSIKSGGTPDSSNSHFYNENGTPWVSIGDMVHGGWIYGTKKHLSQEGIKDKSLITFPIGTLLYSIYASIGKVSILNVPATINQAILAISFSEDYSCILAKYALMAMEDYVLSNANGNTQFNLNSSIVSNLYIPFANFTEQQRIASFLDKKCAEVDEMIALQEKMIEELKAYKQSVITEAVTKGLNPNVPMKDSEIVFYNTIPQHWRETKTLRLLNMPITDGPHETPENVDEGIPFISADAVSDGYINFNNKWGMISREYYDECCKKYIPQREDIYMIKSGASTGRLAIVETDEIFTIWSPLAVFRANKKMILPYYLLYVLKSDGYQKQVENKWSYGTQQNIGMRILEKLIICYPSLDEQKIIINYLNDKCSAIDNLISIKQQKIEHLKDYKKSIIYEYVTGKKEVKE